jgi:hypothetical protein
MPAMLNDGYRGIALGVESAWPTAEMQLALGATAGRPDAAASSSADLSGSAVGETAVHAPVSLAAA